MKTWNIGVIGCGDFLKGQIDNLIKSDRINVKSLFDPDQSRSRHYAEKSGGTAVDSSDAIMNDAEIDLVCLFVPPWIRKGLLTQAAEAGKHIATTKPLGATIEDCEAMEAAVSKAGVRCGVWYSRTDDISIETYKSIFESGEIGKLALYKKDWIHHYPEWNQWAIDPDKNGGPFMDAMIHNMNSACYLMGRQPDACTYFSENLSHPDLRCNDTESMKLDFEGPACAHLFITWAADLAVYSKDGNNREHIDLSYMVTDQGWHLTQDWAEEGLIITASKNGEKKSWKAQPMLNPYEGLIDAIEKQTPLPPNIPDISESVRDIRIIRQAEKNLSTRFSL